MRIALLACLALIRPLEVCAQESPPPPANLPPREAAIDILFQIPPGLTELAEAETNARKLGIPEQTILEARFLFFVEHKNDDGIIGLLPTWRKLAPSFSLDHSEIFATREDFLAVIEFAQALQALRAGQRDVFKKHITEALWLSPSQASAFTPYIQKLRLSEHIKEATISLDATLHHLHESGNESLKNILGEQRAILLHFWSPWSPDCETGMNEFSTLREELKDCPIAYASILIDGRTEILSEARELLKGMKQAQQGLQLVDRAKDSLGSQLRVTDLPTLILLSREGKILSHGTSDSPALRAAIRKLETPKKKP